MRPRYRGLLSNSPLADAPSRDAPRARWDLREKACAKAATSRMGIFIRVDGIPLRAEFFACWQSDHRQSVARWSRARGLVDGRSSRPRQALPTLHLQMGRLQQRGAGCNGCAPAPRARCARGRGPLPRQAAVPDMALQRAAGCSVRVEAT
jgi:hypothetical protein